MKATIKSIAEDLKKEFIGKVFTPCTRRNGKPSIGWMIIGHPGLTRAIKQSGLPYNQFWSGSNPTPSTQSPDEIVMFSRKYL